MADLSDLISKLGRITISVATEEQILEKIIHCMHEASEVGQNNYIHCLKGGESYEHIISKLLTYFPDIQVYYNPNTKSITIDWS